MHNRGSLSNLLFSIVGFIVDRWLKWLATHGTTLGPVNGGVRFEFLPNPSIAFSIALPPTWTLWLIPPVLIVFMWLAVRSYRRHDFVRASAALLVVIASASNYLDRLRYSYVVDYVSFGRWFPVFNMSDVMIVVGLIVLVFRSRSNFHIQAS